MVCRPSVPTRSGRCCTTRVGVGRRAGPGAIPAWSCANANGAWSWSATLMRGRKKLIERAYTLGSQLGLSVWCEDEAGPFQTVPHPGFSWQLKGRPATQPHEYVRAGTAKILTLFHPATGQVQLHPVTRSTNAILHPWLKMTLEDVTARLSTISRVGSRRGPGRMMPTFPRSPLSFRTAGFPQYGWKAGLSGGAFPDRQRLKPAPGMRLLTAGLPSPFVHLRVGAVAPVLRRAADRTMHRHGGWVALRPRGPRSGPGYAVPVRPRLTGPIRPTRRPIATSPQGG